MTVRHHTLWTEPRLAEVYELVADVVRDHAIAEDSLPEIAALLTEIHKADDFLTGVLRDRRSA